MMGNADRNEPTALARFLQDWTALWREELQAQASDPEGMSAAMPAGMLPGMPDGAAASGAMSGDMTAAMETWRAAMVAWAEAMGAEAMGAEAMGADTVAAGTMGVPPATMAASREPPVTSGASAAAAASDPRDAEIDRLARRVDALEARLAKLEPTRRRRG
jgi:hypothetical protein